MHLDYLNSDFFLYKREHDPLKDKERENYLMIV